MLVLLLKCGGFLKGKYHDHALPYIRSENVWSPWYIPSYPVNYRFDQHLAGAGERLIPSRCHRVRLDRNGFKRGVPVVIFCLLLASTKVGSTFICSIDITLRIKHLVDFTALHSKFYFHKEL